MVGPGPGFQLNTDVKPVRRRRTLYRTHYTLPNLSFIRHYFADIDGEIHQLNVNLNRRVIVIVKTTKD